jgi:hypothetical protein
MEDPQSHNRYSYVRNNPLSRIDPTGFDDVGGGGDDTSGGCMDCADDGSNSLLAGSPAPTAPAVGPDLGANSGLVPGVTYSAVVTNGSEPPVGYKTMTDNADTLFTVESIGRVPGDTMDTVTVGVRVLQQDGAQGATVGNSWDGATASGVTAFVAPLMAQDATALAFARASGTLTWTRNAIAADEAAGAMTGPGEIPNQVIAGGIAVIGVGVACYQACGALASAAVARVSQVSGQIAAAVHGNSLSSTRPTSVYQLVSDRDNAVLKYGITSNPLSQSRYPSYVYEIGYFRMVILARYPTRAQARADEFGRCTNYVATHGGALPPLSVIC